MTIRNQNRILLFILGIVVSFFGLCMAAWAIGPVVRKVFGEPFDYLSDYTSPDAWRQSWIIVTSTLMVAFILLGTLLRARKSSTTASNAFVVANPVTVGLAFYLYQLLFEKAYIEGRLGYEYISYEIWALQLVLSFVLYAPVIWIVTRLRR